MHAPAPVQRKVGFINRWANRIVITALFLYIGGHAIAMAGDDPCAPVEERVALTTERMQQTAQSWNDFVTGVTLNREPPSPADLARDSVNIVQWMYMVTEKVYATYVAIRDKDMDKIRGVLLMRSANPGTCNNPVTPPCDTIAGDTGGRLATSGVAVDAARNAAIAAGWSGPDLEIALAIAGAESTYKPDAKGGPNSDGSYDHGIWQINDGAHAEKLASGDRYNVIDNAKMAYAVWSDAGGAWTPWATYKNGRYKEFLPSGSEVMKGCIDVVPGVDAAIRWARQQVTTDCTALVAGAWGAANTPIPGTPAEMFASVAPIPEGRERPGDIRFNEFVDAVPTKIGLLLPGGEMISAPCTGGAVEVDIYDYRGDAKYGRVKATARQEQVETVDASWGSHKNGQIPESALCAPKFAPDHLLRCNAAAAYDKLNVAYAQKFGKGISMTDSYRTYAEQVDLKRRKPNLAAEAGTSEHGWGLAIDLGGGVQNFGTPQHEWMRANASAFGWVHPSWAQQGGSKPEPWHWQYVVPQVAG